MKMTPSLTSSLDAILIASIDASLIVSIDARLIVSIDAPERCVAKNMQKERPLGRSFRLIFREFALSMRVVQ